MSEIVRLCAGYAVPVIPFGTGTSLEGHVNAPYGGVSIDLSRMKRIVAVHAEDLDCVVEAGVTRKQLNEHLRDQGLFFPIDPGADASIGGMAATRASGTNAVRYGTMKDNVLALTVVLPNGDVDPHGAPARKKTSAGYDLTRLFVGSEGTLGIITEITLRLHGIPEAISAGVCPFPTRRGRLRRGDRDDPDRHPGRAHRAARRAAGAGAATATPSSSAAARRRRCSSSSTARTRACRSRPSASARSPPSLGGGPFEWATQAEDRNRLWQARHDAYWAACRLRPGAKSARDRRLRADLAARRVHRRDASATSTASGLLAPIVGHVGDGNFHVLPLVDPDDPDEIARAEAFNERLVERALAMDGTCTGEHGVGQKKMKYLEAEHGAGGARPDADHQTGARSATTS